MASILRTGPSLAATATAATASRSWGACAGAIPGPSREPLRSSSSQQSPRPRPRTSTLDHTDDDVPPASVPASASPLDDILGVGVGVGGHDGGSPNPPRRQGSTPPPAARHRRATTPAPTPTGTPTPTPTAAGAETTLLYRTPRLRRLPSMVFTLGMVREVQRMGREAVREEEHQGEGGGEGEGETGGGRGEEGAEGGQRRPQRQRKKKGLVRVDLQRDSLGKRPMPTGRFQFSSPSIAQRVLAMAQAQGGVQVPLRQPSEESTGDSSTDDRNRTPLFRNYAQYDTKAHRKNNQTAYVLLAHPDRARHRDGAGTNKRTTYDFSRVGLRDVAPLLDLEGELPQFIAQPRSFLDENTDKDKDKLAPQEYFRVPDKGGEGNADADAAAAAAAAADASSRSSSSAGEAALRAIHERSQAEQERGEEAAQSQSQSQSTSPSEEEEGEEVHPRRHPWFAMTLEPALIPPFASTHPAQALAVHPERTQRARTAFSAWKGFRHAVSLREGEGRGGDGGAKALPPLALPIRSQRQRQSQNQSQERGKEGGGGGDE